MIYIYLTPLIPLSFKGEGEDTKKRGEAPLRHPVRSNLGLDKVTVGSNHVTGRSLVNSSPFLALISRKQLLVSPA